MAYRTEAGNGGGKGAWCFNNHTVTAIETIAPNKPKFAAVMAPTIAFAVALGSLIPCDATTKSIE